MSSGNDVNSSGSPAVTRRQVLGKTIAAASLATVPRLEGSTPSDNARTDSLYRIHPAIGIARFGNADPSTFFIGPEVPGYGPSGDAPGTGVSPYKHNGLVKPQAARF